ncbi:MAG: class 1 fructose-bisphosphatase [Longimicrobiales bacterium]|nr:class 1 fructose-bisphosphatase [Longimicrobiales bacterium]
MAQRSVVTIERHIVEQERQHPQATGALSNILYNMALSAKLIAREVSKAGLVDILGLTGDTNVHGEEVKKLDEFADDVIFAAFDHTGLLCCMASEEQEDIRAIPERFPTGRYSLLYDPLDGSSNIDANVSIGTIFSVHSKVSDVERGCADDCLQKGSEQIAAGYIVYGSAVMMIYTTAGSGVHGFTLDPSIGEFLLSHPDIQIPRPGRRIYSVNEAYYNRWSDGQRRLVDHLKGLDEEGGDPFSSRYIGSMVADMHRTLLYGGLFMYPGDTRYPDGKLRLLYEACPMAMIMEQAGGKASNGRERILDVQPESLHQRTPLFAGSAEYVDMAHQYVRDDTGASAG